MTDLTQLIPFVAEHWKFGGDDYPDLAEVEHQTVIRNFAIGHITHHMGKASGALDDVAERIDHGEFPDEAKLRLAIRKLLVNTLRLADVAGMSAGDLVDEITAWSMEQKENA